MLKSSWNFSVGFTQPQNFSKTAIKALAIFYVITIWLMIKVNLKIF